MRKIKPSYRIKSLVRELETLQEPFKYFTPNTIQISFESIKFPQYGSFRYEGTTLKPELNKDIFISGNMCNYIVMIGQSWRFETFEKNGRSLLYRLIAMNVLPERFTPELPKYQQALIEKL